MGRAHEVRKVAMAKTAAKKSKLYAKYGKEIYMQAKNGSPDPESNLNLKRVIERARKEQVPNDIIDRAIEKAKGGSDENYIQTRYEFFGPGGSQFVVECSTDNPTRTVADVRTCFVKVGGKTGSVLHNFEHRAMFSFKGLTDEEVLEALISSDADIIDLEVEDEYVTVYAEINEYNHVRTSLLDAYPNLELEIDEIVWLPLMYIELTDEKDKEALERLQAMLDEIDDVENVFHNIETA